ncbi:MAG: cobalamin biosynthesis protein [Firmicutes bacterium]|nr:cobalamin biosynthesis protein [Bacillota bacterium]
MTFDAIAFTQQGMETGRRIPALRSLTRCPRGGLGEWTAAHWHEGCALLFIGAVGIAVRAIAPMVQSKTRDPAVLVLDEQGKFVIPILSGHIGGANAAAEYFAELLGAVPVLTTATDLRGVFAVDCWAVSQGLSIANPEKIRAVSGRLLAGEPVGLRSELPIAGEPPAGIVRKPPYGIVLSTAREAEGLHLVPKCVTLGIGCRKGISREAIEALLQALPLHEKAVRMVCSIDLKSGEPGLLEFCAAHGYPLRTYSAEELMQAQGEFRQSAFVRSVTGVDNVCERAAVLGGGNLIIPKTAQNGVTMAAAREELSLTFGGSQ